MDLFFNMIKPTNSYFGEKDFQQVKIIQDLVKINHHNIKIIQCPSVRDKTGMSLSSRNSKFSNDELKRLLTFKSPNILYTIIKSMKPNFSFLKSELKNHKILSYLYLKISLKNKIKIANLFKSKKDPENKRNVFPLMPINKDYVYFHKQKSKASARKIKKDLNFTPLFTFEDGFQEIQKWYLWFYNK